MEVNEKFFHFSNTGSTNFEHTNHLKAFLRYLFGAKSGRHIVNELTKHNVCTRDVQDKSAFFFTDNPNGEYYKTIRLMGEEFENYTLYSNDVIYAPFLVVFDGVVISNFLENGKTEPVLQIDSGDAEIVFSEIAQKYAGGMQEFFDRVEAVLEKYDNRLIPYRELRRPKRMIIERTIHRQAELRYPKNPIISISHNDQIKDHPMYHLHRFYRID